MKRKLVLLSLFVLFCFTASNLFAEKQKLKMSFGKVLSNGYFYPVYIGGKNAMANSDGCVEYIISNSSEKRAIAAYQKVIKFYNKSVITKHMGGNKIFLKAKFQRAPIEMKDVFLSQNGKNEPGQGGMILLKREGKIIKVYMFNINDGKLLQPYMN